MKRYLCLILCLVLLPAAAAVQAEGNGMQNAWWLSGSDPEGAFSPIGSLPLQVFYPRYHGKNRHQ